MKLHGGFKSSAWSHTKNLAEIIASHKRQYYKDVKIKKTKTKAFGMIYEIFWGDLK